MSVTYTTAAERDAHRQRQVARYPLPDPLLVATSCVAALAIALASIGRMRSFDDAERGRPTVNLNSVRDPNALEPALAGVFTNIHDRRFAAAALFRYINGEGDRRTLPNVGAIARATVSTKAIREAKNLQSFAERLRARKNRSPADEPIALFTPSEIAKLKPAVHVRTGDQFRTAVWRFGALYLIAFHMAALISTRRGVRSDRMLAIAAHLLTAIGFAVLVSRPDPLRDTLLFVRYAETIALGLAVMTAVSLVDVAALGFGSFSYLPLIAALGLSVCLILFGTGPGRSSAKVNLGPLQPIEGIRLLLALFLAGYFGRRWELLREVRSERIRDLRLPRWLNLPRGEYVLPVLVGVAAALTFFFFQKDLGPALFLCCVFLAVYAVARGRIGMAVAGLVLLASGFYVGYRLNVSSTLADRVRMWQSPWDNGVAGGDQITHAVWALATGGTFGTGLGLGDSRYLPAGHTDLILAAVGEELGAVGLLSVAALFAIITWRGFRIARHASSDYGFFLAMSLTLFLVLPALIMASGVLGVTPLTGVVTPFLSYGGSAMIANFAALGLLAAIHADRRPATDARPFRVPIRNLAAVLGACAIVLVAIAMRLQVVQADDLAVRPHLGVHADGGRRFEYNPRILDLLETVPRGTIFDRRGLPLASGDVAVLDQSRQAFERYGISLARVCSDRQERCYPLEGEAFHVLGDARTRTNWSAANSSYLERDADARLRGFDDHATNVQTFTRDGRPMYTIHRDYRELVPVLRHRHQPDHPAVAALRNRPRDVRTTIDADLQRRVAAIVEAYARRAKGSAAAVVLDPDTGAILASVSYPWPESLWDATAGLERETDEEDVWLDRARYGAYPPGSTFKLLVALAALRDGVQASRYTCARLPDGRIGTRIPGWTRPVRDDVLDTHPHGTIDLRNGLVHSCNAYFAQLAVSLGHEPLSALAAKLKILLTANGSAQRVRDTLPQIGYGQAQVVASPLRMAALAGAVAADGRLRAPYVNDDARPASNVESIADPDAARRLASYMRDIVLSGTARSLRNHPVPIAGKTGTAEVAARDSHGWFVGFAPYGQPPGAQTKHGRRIAFAIVIEHAGYGGATAAPAAGDIVNAAVSAGLIDK
jgi:cell division protein FtsW (lipid II flippase)